MTDLSNPHNHVDNFKSVSVYSRGRHNAEQHIMFSLDQTIVVQPLAMPEEGQGGEVGEEGGGKGSEGGGNWGRGQICTIFTLLRPKISSYAKYPQLVQ